jgi:hypothetical protein
MAVTNDLGLMSKITGSVRSINDDPIDCSLITFLAIAQTQDVGFLPITWQPALATLGEGGGGRIYLSTASPGVSYAFKQMHDSGDSQGNLLSLVSELLILSWPSIKEHPGIVDLEGLCWEYTAGKAHPVLVFEKAVGDLKNYMEVGEGKNLVFEDRLDICLNIGDALITLHECGS